jgi:iron complex outermembrane receptor protein
VVYSVSPKHTLRLTYNQAFQVPTYGEYFILGSFAGVDTGALNQICIVNGAGDCGLGGTTPATYSGNVSLDLEQVETIELGYKGILGSKTLLSVDLFESKNENFVTAFVPQLGPDGTRTNPNFGPWVGPDEAETTPIDPGDCPGIVAPGSSVADCVRAAAPLLPVGPGTLGGLGWQLTNAQDESIVLGLSYTNIGEVDTRGAEVGLNHFFDDRWSMFATYTWLDFEVVDVVEGLEGVIALNAPENKASLGASYVAGRWDASLRGRWVDSFRWFNPMTNGEVESFVTVDLTGNYMINESWKVGLNVANLFDEEHIEAWGADLVGRRALVNVTFAW